MLEQIKLEDVEGKIKSLIKEIESGKEFLITKDNKPLAKLTMVDSEENVGSKESILSLFGIVDEDQADQMASTISEGKTISEREVNF